MTRIWRILLKSKPSLLKVGRYQGVRFMKARKDYSILQ